MAHIQNTDSHILSHSFQNNLYNNNFFPIKSHQNVSYSNIENRSINTHFHSHPYNNSTSKSDFQYNEKIYSWRKAETGPIVKVYGIRSFQDTHRIDGSTVFQNVIQVQKIINNISDFNQFSISELMLVIRKMIEGYQLIYKKIGAVSVSLNKCGINSLGEVKVWINQQFFRNDISGEILNTQHRIITEILEVIKFHFGSILRHFWEYADSALYHSKKNIPKLQNQWNFKLISKVITNFCKSLHLTVPKKLEINQTSSKISRIRRRSCQQQTQSLLEAKFPNMESSILFNPTISIRSPSPTFQNSQAKYPQNNGSNIKNLNQNITKRRITTATCTSAHQKIVSSLFSDKTMPKNHTRHTSSIVNLLPQQAVSINNLIPRDAYSKQKIPSNSINKSIVNTEQMQGIIEQIASQRSQSKNIDRALTSAQEIIKKNSQKYCKSINKSKQSSHAAPSRSKSKSKMPESKILSVQSSLKEAKIKNSQISTTNQSSMKGYQGLGCKNFKDSILTIGQDEKSQSKEKRKFSSNNQHRKRFVSVKQQKWIPYKNKDNSQIKRNVHKKLASNKKVLNSCTNWRNQTQFSHSQTIKQEQQNQKITLSVAEQFKKHGFILNKPALQCLKILTENQIESYQTTQHNSKNNSDNHKNNEQAAQQKIFQNLTNIKQTLFTSTYIDSNSEKKIKNNQNQNIETITNQLKQEEVLRNNCWTKKIQGLLKQSGAYSQLKQSFNSGEQIIFNKNKEIKLSMLGKLGRQIGRSVIPEVIES